MRNEIVENMSIDHYHIHPGLSNTGLKLILDCPQRYYTEYLDPNKPPRATPKHFKIGRAVHTLFLEPEKFTEQFYVFPKCDRRTKEGKEAYAKAEIDAKGKELLSGEELMDISGMADSLAKIEWLKKLRPEMKIEQSLFWEDAEHKVQLKSRPDIHTGNLWIDIKTTSSANFKDFTRSIYNFGYHTQAAMAQEAFKARYKKDYKFFIFVVVEESYPFLTASFVLDDASLTKGYDDFRKGVKIYKECVDKNIWPGYDSKIQTIKLPEWMNS